MGHDAAGAIVAIPPTMGSFAKYFRVPEVESSVRVGFVEGEKERVSPVHETASTIVALRLITCGLGLFGRGGARLQGKHSTMGMANTALRVFTRTQRP